MAQTKAQLIDGKAASVEFSIGSASAPSVTFTSDTNTGIYSPGADTVAISTNGSGRLFIDSSGNVGVGASSSTGKFNVNVPAGASLQRALYATNATDADFQVQISTGYTFVSTTTATPLAFGNGTTERMRIDSSGRLLVGTTSTVINTDQLQVVADSTNAIGVACGRNDIYGARIDLVKSRGSTASPVVVNNNDQLGTIWFGGYTTSYQSSALIEAYADGAYAANNAPGRLVFSTAPSGSASPVERMRLNAGGSLSLNGTTIVFNGSGTPSSTTTTFAISYNANDWYLSNSTFSKYAQLAGQNFTGWTFGSDRRIKENIVDLDYGIDQLKQIKARRFNFIGEATPSIGFIAQELQEVVPEAVTGTEIPFAEDDTPQEKAGKTMGVTKDVLIPVLVKALQEAVIKIETLEAKVAALEAP